MARKILLLPPVNRRVRFIVMVVAMTGWSSSSRGVDDPANSHPERLIAPLPLGALGRPFGESVVVQGEVVEGPFKYEASFTEGRLLVQRINGVATQQGVLIRFDPITSRAWWHELDHPEGDKLWQAKEKKLKAMRGKTFEMRGYERGGHAGMTQEESIIQVPVQSGGLEFRMSFQPLMMKMIPKIHFTPADFINRVAELEGRAETRNGAGWMIGTEGWALQVHDTAWPADYESREIWAKGRVARSATGGWRLEEADSRLLRLDDQLGKKTKLDGVAWALNDVWWFEYGGEKLYVENQKDLPGWTSDFWGRVITISGVLGRARLPDIGQISLKTDRDLREYFVVRGASWSALDQSWKKPSEIPKAPPLTTGYLKSCGIKLEDEIQKHFDEWLKKTDR